MLQRNTDVSLNQQPQLPLNAGYKRVGAPFGSASFNFWTKLLIEAGYTTGYVASVLLLLLAQRAGLPAATTTAYRLLDVLSLPLPLMFAYPFALPGRSWPAKPAA